MEAKLAVIGVDGHRNKDGKSFLAKGVSVKSDQVPVWMEAKDDSDRDFAHMVGRAKVSVHDGVLWADCQLVEERFSAPLLKLLYPHPLCIVMRRTGNVIAEMVVEGINLSFDPPTDGRIPTMGAQGIKSARKE
jgi:hypothetical protein